MGISLKGFGDAAGSGTGASVSGISALPPQAAAVRLPSATVVTPAGGLLYTLENPNSYGTTLNDNFGYSVGLTSSYSIVGVPNEGEASGLTSGKAYIFNNSGTLIHTLDNPNDFNTVDGDLFGYAVDINETYAIVSAPEEDSGSYLSTGRVYIFNSATGALIHTLSSPTAPTANNRRFGRFDGVSISDTYAFVGAYYDGAGGRAYIFNPTTGSLLHTLDNPNYYGTSANDMFGRVLAIDTYAVVGVPNEDSATALDSGVAYIFDPVTGALLWELPNPEVQTTNYHDYGLSIDTSGDYTIVGARSNSNNEGKAYIFNNVTGSLVHTLNNPNAEITNTVDLFGSKVSIDGNYAVVIAKSEDGDAIDTGYIYVYDVTTGELLLSISNPEQELGNSLTSVCVNGTQVIVGAPFKDDTVGGNINSGQAYIFSIT